MMLRAFWTAVLLLCVLVPPLPAQRYPPGYVDPAPVLAAAAAEIGEGNLRCVTFSGSRLFRRGRADRGERGQHRLAADRRPGQLHPHHQLGGGTSVETFDREPGLDPASWKYGLGWQGGTPVQKATRQTHIVNGDKAWHIDGDGPPVAVAPGSGRALPARSVAQPARASSRRRGCPAPTRSPSGAGSRSRRAATATSSPRSACTSWPSPCSGSTASTRPSTRRTRSSASRRR